VQSRSQENTRTAAVHAARLPAWRTPNGHYATNHLEKQRKALETTNMNRYNQAAPEVSALTTGIGPGFSGRNFSGRKIELLDPCDGIDGDTGFASTGTTREALPCWE
jgi:hypothetical protein